MILTKGPPFNSLAVCIYVFIVLKFALNWYILSHAVGDVSENERSDWRMLGRKVQMLTFSFHSHQIPSSARLFHVFCFVLLECEIGCLTRKAWDLANELASCTSNSQWTMKTFYGNQLMTPDKIQKSPKIYGESIASIKTNLRVKILLYFTFTRHFSFCYISFHFFMLNLF